jgi:hypothetical protein
VTVYRITGFAPNKHALVEARSPWDAKRYLLGELGESTYGTAVDWTVEAEFTGVKIVRGRKKP